MKKLRLFYAAGPGDVIGTYHYWKKGQDDPTLLGYTDSGAFYDLVQDLDAEALVVASCARAESFKEGPFTIEHLPKKQYTGVLFHLNQFWYGLKLCYKALRFKTDVAVIEEGSTHWFVCSLLSYFGVAVIPSLKCTLWRRFQPLDWKQKILNYLDRGLFQSKALAILSMSSSISDQVAEMTESDHREIISFLPVYKKDVFADIPPPEHSQQHFRVLYVGRIEVVKGVFDMVEIARRFKAEGLKEIHFDFCGNGTALEDLRKKIRMEGLQETCHTYGYCAREKLKERLAHSHVVVAPSRTAFDEGFCMVVVEGVLAGRPVVTSSVCPALFTVKEAALEAQPDSVESYAQALKHLYGDRAFYLAKQSACHEVSQSFYDTNQGWGAAVRAAIANFSAKEASPPGDRSQDSGVRREPGCPISRKR